ncbi:hypothetical protein B0H11DRAFT_827261 [Mycena galericulata]|nr:hypothetical protein B0H11DRAFT_827261 [Mycena galericulata]
MEPPALAYAINHLFLPPQLPQEDDSTDYSVQHALLQHISRCADAFSANLELEDAPEHVQAGWIVLRTTLKRFTTIQEGSRIAQGHLETSLNAMEDKDVICLHVSRQNAGVILRRADTQITVEYFQASPKASLVTRTKGKLYCQFPSRPRVSFPFDTQVIRSLAALLTELDAVQLEDALPFTTKAKSTQPDTREVPDIRYISELLGGIARALTPDPETLAAQTTFVTKRVGDHALLKNANQPWRRSPKWLIVRVTAQTTLEEFGVPQRYGYKAFVAFVLAKTLHAASTADVSDDVLFAMNAKIATRMYKLRSVFDLEPPAPLFPLDFISDQIGAVEIILREHWDEVQNREASASTWVAPTDAQITAAQHFTLPRSSAYFLDVRRRREILSREDTNFSPPAFDETLLKTYTPRQQTSPPLSIPSTLSETDLSLAILDVEQWVAKDLDHWSTVTSRPNQMVKLKQMIEEHGRLVHVMKPRMNPEMFSRLFLTILELWVAMDKAATTEVPLLADYSPELDIKAFEPLVLPELSQMQRLYAVEAYLANRHMDATYPDLSLFKLSTDTSSFPARFFARSQSLQTLRRSIQDEAKSAKARKLVELEQKRIRYANLIKDAARHQHSCSAEIATSRRQKYRYTNCTACSLRNQANAVSITVFEWPLPDDDILSRNVVFELCLPSAYGIWRDTTFKLARDHSGPRERTYVPRIGPILSKYLPLAQYFTPNTPGQQITLASTSKPFGECNLPCKATDVIKDHPLHYRLWDESGDWLPASFPAIEIRPRCTPDFPEGPYKCLAWSATETTHTPNMVIARQSECPVSISYHEFEAFGHLRAGVRLQWRNVMLQLMNGTVNLADPAVYLLFRQASCQVEIASEDEVLREAHFDLSDENFGQEVLAVIGTRFDAISGNWQEGWTAATLSDLACRLFSLSQSAVVQEAAFTFLSRLRDVLFQWMKQVLLLLKNQSTLRDLPTAKSELVHRVLQLATACRSTYMVGKADIGRVFAIDGAVSIFLQCAIAIQNNLPSNSQTLPSALRYLVQRDAFFSTMAAEHLMKAISWDGKGLEDAIRSVWEGFSRDPFQAWRTVAERWVTCSTPAFADSQVRHVHLNIIDGSLLADGKAMGTLPRAILDTPMFRSLFPNQATLDITPSTMRGMAYQSRANIDDFEVHFKLGSENNLLVRIRHSDSNFASEFIPRERLEGDIPTILLLDNVHVFHEETQSMDIVPATSGWNPRAQAVWQMKFVPDAEHPILSKNTGDHTSEAVMNPNSGLVEGISSIFQPLETSKLNLLVSSKSEGPFSSPTLHVGLPRYNLDFSFNPDTELLESSELPGFSVSRKQSVGTLIGLNSKLVIESQDAERVKVVVPEGEPTTIRSNFHAQTTIMPSAAAKHLKAFIYDVDDIIGRIIGDGTMTSWYLLIYLHIVTASHLPDPLIRRTGLQQALEMLASPQSFAFMDMKPEHLAQLQQIIDLAPRRHYFPRPYSSMEAVGWNTSLSPLIQSGRFVPLVNAIVDYARRQAIFYPSAQACNFSVAYKGDPALRQRAEFRTSRLVSDVYPDEADAPAVPDRCLECPESVSKEQAVRDIATLVYQSPPRVRITQDLWTQLQDWGTFSTGNADNVKLHDFGHWLSDSPKVVWFRLFSLCRSSDRRDRPALIFALGILTYRGIHLDLVRTLLAIAISGRTDHNIHAAISALPVNEFDLKPGHGLVEAEVSAVVTQNCRSYETVAEALVPKIAGEDDAAYSLRKRKTFLEQHTKQCRELSERIFGYWPLPGAPLTLPDAALILPDNLERRYPIVKIEPLRRAVSTLLPHKLRNRRLFESVVRLQQALSAIHNLPLTGPLVSFLPPTPPMVMPPRQYEPVTLASLLETRNVTIPARCRSSYLLVDDDVDEKPSKATRNESKTRDLIRRLERMEIDGPKTQYITDISRCIDAFEARNPEAADYLLDPIDNSVQDLPAIIQTALGPETLLQQLLRQTGQWPSTGPQSLLVQLTRERWHVLPESWKKIFSQFSEVLIRMQKERRGSEENAGVGWDPVSYPDWLLFQLDADLLIRPVQASIAKQMISPDSNANALMQLNMGEGKSSVIVPMIAAFLADGKQLVRVDTLKALSNQMFQLLKQRLCGLVNRRLFYLPFSRDIQPLKSSQIEQIVALMKECARVGGILLCQPEHILSFQLMGLDTFCRTESATNEETRLLTEAQEWLDEFSRDILDESDEILSVRYQLIYTVGSASPLEGQPWRWNVIQEVFSLVQEVATSLVDLEIGTVAEPCRFPITRILTATGGRVLVKTLVNKIVAENRLEQWISFRNYSSEQKNIVSRFLRQLSFNQADNKSLQEFSGDRFSLLLLLRGLLAHGILKLSLQEKRWRVDYGLDPKRSMLAVPYRAKDSPAPRAEFGHPDMIIVLTCLSYYYGGLTDDQLNTTFTLLLNSDNPAIRYEQWVKGYGDDLPQELANLCGLNLDDFEQKNLHIFPRLRYNKGVIDFYLSECVFPKEAREFPHKLTTNAWDLARSKTRLTTGFSGTNDNRYLLPLSIDQLDQDSQRHTNAQVLEFLLKPENNAVLCTDSDNAMGLLQRLVQQTPAVMVLLDVGAQVLELQNEDVAREWLKLDTRPHIEAAVYFNPNDDEILVLLRDGRVEPFTGSLYRTQLDKTLVYLDEAHTRGTDFKFPPGSRAVVTLGPKLTKDKLVQGCMRMRKLGNEHSVLFFASKEIWTKITDVCVPKPTEIDSSHVLLWTMHETCTQIRDNGPLWASQGVNFDVRHTACEEQRKGNLSDSALKAILKEQESRSLEELYGAVDLLAQTSEGSTKLQKRIKDRCDDLGFGSARGSRLSEEQERELAHEKEDEREVERISHALPLDHRVDRRIYAFIQAGTVSNTFISFEDCLAKTSQISLLPDGQIFRGHKLRATTDFRDTVVLPPGLAKGSMDGYLRGVQWILSSDYSDVLLLISPFEANELLPTIRKSEGAHLHLYSPRVSRNIRSLETLDAFAVPTPRHNPPTRMTIHELNLFAGQLFLADKPSMRDLCSMLGLYLGALPRHIAPGTVDATGFVRVIADRTTLGIGACSFASNPLPFLRGLYGWRRKGQGFGLTHIGKILNGNNLDDSEFELGG